VPRSAKTILSAIARVTVSLAIALAFSVVVAVSLFALSSPLMYFGGYDGIMLGLLLAIALALGLTAYLTPRLYRSFGKNTAKD
jgi:hypothetical protein